jgi:hypothetical protein
VRVETSMLKWKIEKEEKIVIAWARAQLIWERGDKVVIAKTNLTQQWAESWITSAFGHAPS